MIKIQSIKIPDNITGQGGNVEYYLSNYPQFIDSIPGGWVVLNKKLTGCGATTFFLDMDKPLILCSHRLELLECKARSDRHKDKVYLFNMTDDKNKNMSLLHAYLDQQRNFNNRAPKILVTVDSLKHVNTVLSSRGEIKNYNVVSDEMQCLFTDAAFKGDVVLSYLQDLKLYQNVIFLSATPYLESYLDQVPEFNIATYIEIEWPDTALIKPSIQALHVNSLRSAANGVIKKFQVNGFFEEILVNGSVQRASRAVFYFNDITAILNVIGDCGLDKKDCNIICSKSNPKTLKKLNAKGFSVGSAQKEGDQHATYTFVTKAAFEGVDMYHPDAYTFIFCNPNKENLALDLAIDIEQILGRQRLISNPFHSHATIFYKLTDADKLETAQDFQKHISEKSEFTELQKDNINKLTGNMKQRMICQIKASHDKIGFSNDYLSVTTDQITGEAMVIKNNLVMLNEIRAWDIRSNDFINKIRLLNTLGQIGTTTTATSTQVQDLIALFNSTKDFTIRMKAYCQCRCPDNEVEIESSVAIPNEYHYYYRELGVSGISRCSYEKKKLDEVLNANMDQIKAEVYSWFKCGVEYQKKYIKAKLSEIYARANYNGNAKATDLLQYFTLKDNKVRHSFTIIKPL